MADDPLFDAPPQNDQFETAILCALGFESSAVEQLFDEVWYDDQIKKHPKDRNTYTTGSIDERLVVLAWMHGIGKAKAASVAGDLRFSFDNIKHIFVVGVCGGLPKSTEDQDILLGDIIISTHLQKYDEGKQYPTGYLAGGKCNPDRETLPFLTKLKESSHTQERLLTLCVKNLKDKFGGNKHRPGPQDDRLYQSQYLHKHYDKSCQVCNISPDSVCDAARTLNCDELQCGNSHLVERKRLRSILKTPSDEGKKYPIIHIGAIGSGDTVMKSGNHRDRVAKQEQVIAFEMEGAGVYEQIGSVVVIKAVCDYADSHKNKQWQRYAAMTAAACTKAFLLMRSGGQSWRARAREILHPHLIPGLGHASHHRSLSRDAHGPRPTSSRSQDGRQQNVPRIILPDEANQGNPPSLEISGHATTENSMARESPHHNSNNPSKAISKTPQLLSEDLVQQTPGDAITSQEPIQHQPNPSPELYESTRQDEIDQEASAERQITTLAKASSLGSADPSPPYPGDKTQQEPTEKNPGVTPEIWAQFQEFQAFKAMVDMRNSQQEPTPIPQVPQNDEPQSANVTNPETTAAVTLDVGQLHSGRASAEHTAPETQPKSPSKIQQELVIEKDIIIKNNMAMATTTIAVQEVAGLITPPTEDLPPTPTPQSFILEEQMMPSPTENLASTPMPQSFVPEEKMTLPLTPIREDPQLTSQLLEACEKRDVPTIQTLLTNPHLLDLTATGPKGKTLLHLALGTRRLNSSPEELHSLNEAIRLLCAAGIPLNASDASRDESAPLHICATYYFTEAAGHLLDAGADPNVVDKKGRTPLYLIAGDSKPDIELARMLRLKGGNLGGKMFRKQAKPSEKQATVWALIGI